MNSNFVLKVWSEGSCFDDRPEVSWCYRRVGWSDQDNGIIAGCDSDFGFGEASEDGSFFEMKGSVGKVRKHLDESDLSSQTMAKIRRSLHHKSHDRQSLDQMER